MARAAKNKAKRVNQRQIPVKGAAGANHHKHEHPHKVFLPNRPYVLEQSEETLVIIQDTSEAWGYACLFPILAPCAFCCMPQVRRRREPPPPPPPPPRPPLSLSPRPPLRSVPTDASPLSTAVPHVACRAPTPSTSAPPSPPTFR